MTLKERCQTGESKLELVSAALLDPRPEILDTCESDLQEVIALLEGEPATLNDKADLLRLQQRVGLLGLQVQQATNLCQGWLQLIVSSGYTDDGRPSVPPSEPSASYEV